MNVIQATKLESRIMRYELGDDEWGVIKPMLPWANIPPKRNRKEPICFGPYLYRARNLVERFDSERASAEPETDCAAVPAATSPRPGKLTVKQLPRSAS